MDGMEERILRGELAARAAAIHADELADALRALSGAVALTREGKRDGYTFGNLSAKDDAARAALAKYDAAVQS